MAAENAWSTGLCNCCADPGGCGTCFCSFCCAPCQYGKNVERIPASEVYCGSNCCGAGCCFCLLGLMSFVPGVGLSCFVHMGARNYIRMKYGIPGNGCSDCATTWCCIPCALCQESRELTIRQAVQEKKEIKSDQVAPAPVAAAAAAPAQTVNQSVNITIQAPAAAPAPPTPPTPPPQQQYASPPQQYAPPPQQYAPPPQQYAPPPQQYAPQPQYAPPPPQYAQPYPAPSPYPPPYGAPQPQYVAQPVYLPAPVMYQERRRSRSSSSSDEE
ncbi:Protein PLANT CADMIUM RESISTANCE 3 [Tetrabaena socialis]|uniref:Protein PLANT CADMIUM RESISTANCE 3 n=1 Tax=Tetrabaena socialis TaxID=47790 RepID=A0A2J7ZZ62_9CHLO|nr:Protein PLANT CADMIUM RESISTANCE 3 [Tetrabaena socialis]|eukprot:PNH05560.1 Protein PLANT CADMIUM RESISTANCE 3 [Tetrabaena socialis]